VSASRERRDSRGSSDDDSTDLDDENEVLSSSAFIFITIINIKMYQS